MIGLLALLSVTSASDPLWPDLSEPPSSGGGSRDAALVVAISDYALVSDINGAKTNGLDWYTWLTESRGISAGRVELLVDSEGVKERIEKAATNLQAKVKPGGTLWFIFVGHGAPSRDGRDGLLVGWDTQQNADSIYARGILQSELLATLAQGSQDRTVAIIDACFSGKGSTGDVLVDDLQPMIPESAMSTGQATVITAGRSDEFAGSLPGAARPAFSYLMLGAMRGWGDADGNGQVTVREAAEYSRDALASLPLGRNQTPEYRGPASDSVLARGREAGPSLSAIRRALAGGEDTPGGAIGVDVGEGNLADRLAQLTQLQAEEEARKAEMARIRREIDAEIARKSRTLRSEASGFWSQVTPLAESGSEVGREALRSFISKYDGAAVTVGDERRVVEIPEVAQAQAWLARYDSGGAGDVWVGRSGYEMVWVEPGSFTMGSPSSENGRDSDETSHGVELTEGFYVGTVEVTQALWSSVMGSNPASGKDYKGISLSSSEYPAIYISWCDSVIFANKLSTRDGLQPAYRLPSRFTTSMSDDSCKAKSGDVSWDRSADGYRLLTEAEWEYAARADTDGRYAGTSRDADMCRYGNVANPSAKSAFEWSWDVFPCEDGHKVLAPVGSFEPNAWGVYDMTGNVWEWCWDWYGNYPANASVDPIGASSGSLRVRRGGSWNGGPPNVRAAYRLWSTPALAWYNLGLRLSRSD